MDWQDKKDVLLKALFDRDKRKKAPGPPGVPHEKAREAMGVSVEEMRDLEAELYEDGYIRKTFTSLDITTKGRRYVRKNWDYQIKDVWQKYKNDKLENLGEN